jgi:hypothetical protein
MIIILTTRSSSETRFQTDYIGALAISLANGDGVLRPRPWMFRHPEANLDDGDRGEPVSLSLACDDWRNKARDSVLVHCTADSENLPASLRAQYK